MSQEVIDSVWQHVVRLFAEQDLHHPARSRLVLDESFHDNCRHFAATEIDGSRVYVAPSLVDMPFETLVAILAHEAGHVEDLRSPGIWWYRGGQLRKVDELPSKGARKLLIAWRERSDDEVERVADALGELALGERIGYVGSASCLVQAVGMGRSRPKGLR